MPQRANRGDLHGRAHRFSFARRRDSLPNLPNMLPYEDVSKNLTGVAVLYPGLLYISLGNDQCLLVCCLALFGFLLHQVLPRKYPLRLGAGVLRVQDVKKGATIDVA